MEFRLGATVWADPPIAASVMQRTAANILRRRSIGLSSLNLSGGSIRRARERVSLRLQKATGRYKQRALAR